jgi:hypothetical protein
MAPEMAGDKERMPRRRSDPSLTEAALLARAAAAAEGKGKASPRGPGAGAGREERDKERKRRHSLNARPGPDGGGGLDAAGAEYLAGLRAGLPPPTGAGAGGNPSRGQTDALAVAAAALGGERKGLNHHDSGTSHTSHTSHTSQASHASHASRQANHSMLHDAARQDADALAAAAALGVGGERKTHRRNDSDASHTSLSSRAKHEGGAKHHEESPLFAPAARRLSTRDEMMGGGGGGGGPRIPTPEGMTGAEDMVDAPRRDRPRRAQSPSQLEHEALAGRGGGGRAGSRASSPVGSRATSRVSSPMPSPRGADPGVPFAASHDVIITPRRDKSRQESDAAGAAVSASAERKSQHRADGDAAHTPRKAGSVHRGHQVDAHGEELTPRRRESKSRHRDRDRDRDRDREGDSHDGAGAGSAHKGSVLSPRLLSPRMSPRMRDEEDRDRPRHRAGGGGGESPRGPHTPDRKRGASPALASPRDKPLPSPLPLSLEHERSYIDESAREGGGGSKRPLGLPPLVLGIAAHPPHLKSSPRQHATQAEREREREVPHHHHGDGRLKLQGDDALDSRRL